MLAALQAFFCMLGSPEMGYQHNMAIGWWEYVGVQGLGFRDLLEALGIPSP